MYKCLDLTTINSRYLSPIETDFTERVVKEINLFKDKQSFKSVLVFPPLLRRYRYLFHELTQRYFGHTFGTVSIGTEGNRRPLLYYKSVIDSIKMSQKLESDLKDENFVNDLPQLDFESDFKPNNCHKKDKHFDKNNDRRHRRPDMKLYVPPKAKSNTCADNDINDFIDKTCEEDINQKTCETVECLSELEITDSSHEKHEINSNTNQSKPLTDDCVHKCSHNSTNCDQMSASGEPNATNEETNDESSWDSMFDDNGECIRPEFMQKVNDLIDSKDCLKLEKTRIDYLNFQYNEPEIDNSEFGHVLEVYDFDTEFKTQDIITSISVFNFRDFDVKWVDDSHALAVFSTQNAANEALKQIYPNMKLRPLSLAIRESKVKARKCAEFLQPYKQRPQTSASLARRLVTQSLGLRDRISPEQRAAERKKLADAKERRRLAVKQGQDVWEGNVS